MDDVTTRTVEIANRVGQQETNIVPSRANPDGPVANIDRKTDHHDASPVDRVDRREGVEGSLAGATQLPRGAPNEREPVTLSYIGQLAWNLMNATKNSRASDTHIMNPGWSVGAEQDSSSTLHFLLLMTTTGQPLDIVGIAGEGEGLETSRLLVLEFDPRAKSRAAGLMQKSLAFDFTSHTASSELFDKECLRIQQVTGIDIQDEVKCGLATLHMQDVTMRHHLITHARRLDMLSEVRKKVQDIFHQAINGLDCTHAG